MITQPPCTTTSFPLSTATTSLAYVTYDQVYEHFSWLDGSSLRGKAPFWQLGDAKTAITTAKATEKHLASNLHARVRTMVMNGASQEPQTKPCTKPNAPKLSSSSRGFSPLVVSLHTSCWIAALVLSELQHAFREFPVICSVLRCAYAWISYCLTPIGGVNAAAILPETDSALT